jgi:gliding motility-associated-like protein
VNGNITLSPSTGGTWSSSATGVATITNGGVVTGVSSGNADMTFTNTTTGCSSASSTGNVVVNPLEDATFSYPASTYCITSPSDPIATVTGVTGGTFSIDNGGTIASATGEIDLDANGVQNYTVTYTTSGTCPGTETFALSVSAGPQATFSYTGTPYCGGTGTADVTYGAGGSAGAFAPVPATTDLVISAVTGAVDLNTSVPGTYTVENDIVASGGCAASYATSDITITAQEDATYSYSSTTFCENESNPSATITGTVGGVFTATPAGITVNGSTGEIDLTASTFGTTYSVRYITPGTCSDTLDIDITLESSPTAPTAGTTAGSNTICDGASADITASGSTGTGVTYAVFDAATNGTNLGTTPLTVSPIVTTTYYVESFNSNGCGNIGGRQSVTVTVNPTPSLSAGADETLCPGDNVTLTATGTGSVLWSTTETTASITVSPSVTTTYTVTLTDGNTCTNTDDVIVTVVTNGGTLIAVDDAFMAETDTPINFDILSNDTYGGNTSTIVLTPTNGTATADINGNINYQSDAGFVGSDSLTYEICDVNCSAICDIATVIITVDKTIDFSVPGGFSPNGDNINDIFVIQGLDEYPDNNLSIFNRWGNIIFQAAPYNNDWDGSATEGVVLGGDKVTSGTYFYILELGEGIEPLRGSIEIKRD